MEEDRRHEEEGKGNYAGASKKPGDDLAETDEELGKGAANPDPASQERVVQEPVKRGHWGPETITCHETQGGSRETEVGKERVEGTRQHAETIRTTEERLPQVND